jgi:cytochrome c oxidase subunit 3
MSTATARLQANRTLLAGILATVVMLFTAFAAAYLERSSANAEWRTVALPQLLWLTTGILLASSVTVELARRKRSRAWLVATLVLGFAFLAGQLGAWFELRGEGVFLPTNAYASFFYILSGVHGVHIIGGLVALAVAARKPAVLDLCAGFWHFMGAVWLYVLFVLVFLK